MKIAFATDDKKTISKITGRAKWFAFYDIENGDVKSIDYIENIHEHDDHDHDHHHGHDHNHDHNHDHHHHDGHGHGHGHGEGHGHGYGNHDGKGHGLSLADGKGENHHNGHEYKKVLYEIASRKALFITRHLGKQFRKGVEELGIEYKMIKDDSIEDAIKNL
ncbi:MAG: hypothetical protein ABFR62_00930 [Bacteroidota bacterium]